MKNLKVTKKEFPKKKTVLTKEELLNVQGGAKCKVKTIIIK